MVEYRTSVLSTFRIIETTGENRHFQGNIQIIRATRTSQEVETLMGGKRDGLSEMPRETPERAFATHPVQTRRNRQK